MAGLEQWRVCEVYVAGASGGNVGSGYLVSESLVLTAAHVVDRGENVHVRPVGADRWRTAQMAWSDPHLDAALLRIDTPPEAPTGWLPMSWGRIEGTEAVSCAAVGFPRAQARGGVRDTEHIKAELAPLSNLKAGRLALTLLSSRPAPELPGEPSPWAGMSGAALFAGAHIVGVIVVDPPGFGTDRIVATPVSALAEDAEFARLVGGPGGLELEAVGPQMTVGGSVVTAGSRHGNFVDPVPEAVDERITRRPGPVHQPPRRNQGFLGRELEVKAAVDDLENGASVEFHGEAGVGKTWMLSHLAHHTTVATADGVLWFRAQSLRLLDIKERLFQTFYTCKDRHSPNPADLDGHLRTIEALVLIDDLSIGHHDMQELLSTAGGCTFLVAGELPHLLGEGETYELGGLDPEASLALFESTMRRPLEEAEREDAAVLGEALAGHPQRMYAVARMAARGRATLAEMAGHARLGQAELIAFVVGQLSDDERRLYGLVVAAGGAPVRAAHAAAVLGRTADEARATLSSLKDQGFLRTNSPTYSRTFSLDPALERQLDVERLAEALLDHLVRWTEENRRNVDLVADDLDLLLSVLGWAARTSRWEQVIALVRAVELTLVVSRRWGGWEDAVHLAIEAARATGDASAEGWCLHQLGTRALSIGDVVAARRQLEEALAIRRRIGDAEGEAATLYHLDRLDPPPALPPGPEGPPGPDGPPGRPGSRRGGRLRGRGRLGFLAVAIAVIAALLATNARGEPPTSSTTTATSAPSAVPTTETTDTTATPPPVTEGPATPVPTAVRRLSLTVDGKGAGDVRSEPGGLDCGRSCESSFGEGTAVVLTATAAPGSGFSGWSGGPCSGTSACRLTIDGDTTITATFQPAGATSALAVVKGGDGNVTSDPSGISCGAVCQGNFPKGGAVTLTATAAPGSVFTGWSKGPCAGTSACQLTLDGDATVTATFAPAPVPTRVLAVARAGKGSVTSDPSGIQCGAVCQASFPEDGLVTLTATADPGSVFAGWSNGPCQGSGPCQIKLTGDTTVTATFKPAPQPRRLTVKAVGKGAVIDAATGTECTGMCERDVPAGSKVTLKADPAKGWALSGWEGVDCQAASCTFAVDADMKVTAAFKDVEPPKAPTSVEISWNGCKHTISWRPASDNDAVAFYVVYRDAAVVGTTKPPVTQFVEDAGGGTKQYYRVAAVDRAGNLSPPSAPVEWPGCPV